MMPSPGEPPGVPGRRPAALARFAQAEMLRRTLDEEALLSPAAAATWHDPWLARDHARLRSAADLLARAAAGQLPMSPAQVAAAVRDFAAQLECHLRAEENLLAGARAATP